MRTATRGVELRRSRAILLGPAIVAAALTCPVTAGATTVGHPLSGTSRPPAVAIGPRILPLHRARAAATAPAPARGTAPHATKAAPTITSGGTVYPGWVSENWSGYALSGGPYTSVSGQWTVPSVTPTVAPTYSVMWLGIDGFSSSDPSIIQVGTDQRSVNGTTSYSAWWTTSASGYIEQPLGGTVGPGDAMSGTITQASGATWVISLTDLSHDWTARFPVAYYGPGQSAEWIMEAPSVDGQPSTLASYIGTGFDLTTVNGADPTLLPTDAGEMVPPGAVLAQSSPSIADTDTDGFNLVYGFTPPLPPLS
ncbi:MAG: G1 family glutamic endopeptidase [Acidimicrobiales bacterium]